MVPSPKRPARRATERFYVSAYASQWVDGDLAGIPFRLVSGNLDTREAYLLAGGLGYVVVPRFDLTLPFCGGCALRGNSIELEGVVAKHFDRQDHWEIAGGVFARSGQVPLFLGLELNLAGGIGLSYALSDAGQEVGRNGQRGIDTYNLQIYLAFETEFAAASVPEWSVVGRIHHRSGGYGLLTEGGNGSDFVGLGVRRGF